MKFVSKAFEFSADDFTRLSTVHLGANQWCQLDGFLNRQHHSKEQRHMLNPISHAVENVDHSSIMTPNLSNWNFL